MVIVMQRGASEDQISAVIKRLTEKGFDVHRSTGAERTILGAVGGKVVDTRDYELLGGVKEVIRITHPYKLSSRTFKPEGTRIRVGDVEVGGDKVTVIAGPCSVESRDQIQRTAEALSTQGVRMLRGGAFKPRTSPYSFQGLGEEGLKYMRETADRFGMKVVSEIMDHNDLPMMLNYVDVFQVGARNMQNYTILKELGKIKSPVLLKRGMSATIEDMLLSAEYVMSGGNHEVILCERGIRTFETYTRNTLDLSAIPVVKKLSHLPIIVDPSHGTGLRDKVIPMARAAVAAGADGLLVEVHCDPENALSDGAQSLFPEQFADLMRQLKLIGEAVGRKI
ncbi:MAG TPA: 3-deoxy-7-phosphoheptulonate synthase [Acidobacteriota bacterium]|jgi:3-deoxy-7-phosphoheptulonate synthase